MKKLWISVKRGFIREPKHRLAVGECIWLFEYMLDIANWDTGIISDWTDESAAEDMEMPIRTLREQRRKLADGGYISSKQKLHGQDITIHNWTNPRDYSGEKLNEKHGGSEASPSKTAHGDTHGYTHGSSQDVTPTSSSKTKESLKASAKTPKPPTPDEVCIFRETTERFPQKINYPDVVMFISDVSKRLGRPCVPDDLRPFYAAWCGRDYRKNNINWLSWAVTGIIPPQTGKQFGKPSEPKGFDAARKFLENHGVVPNG